VLKLTVKIFCVATLGTAKLIADVTREDTGFHFGVEEPYKNIKDT